MYNMSGKYVYKRLKTFLKCINSTKNFIYMKFFFLNFRFLSNIVVIIVAPGLKFVWCEFEKNRISLTRSARRSKFSIFETFSQIALQKKGLATHIFVLISACWIRILLNFWDRADGFRDIAFWFSLKMAHFSFILESF